MIRRALCLGLLFLLPACSGTPWWSPNDRVQVRQVLGKADGLARDGDHAGARALYLQVIQEHPSGQWTARALFRLARLMVTPESPIRDYRQAYRYFDRLLIEHPGSAEADEARAWREALGQLLAREQEAVRIRQDLERLKKIDTELERRRP
jgi:outer membrane protein assembly factor BamD (BamD/ComL family)